VTYGDQGLDPLSLERIVPDKLSDNESTGAETLRFHLERYQFASRNLIAGRVLDLACGVGYGTALLSENPAINDAVGVDLDSASIEYARRKYMSKRISFVCAEALQFRPEHLFDNVVSLETIEHVEDPSRLFANLISLLAPGGRLIASVPVTPSVDANPHHKTNFSKNSFLLLGKVNGLKYIDSLNQIQPFSPFAIAARREARSASLRKNLIAFYFHNPSHFWLRLWSTARDGFVNKYLTVVLEKSR
jgi:SAM-dependent methyltransferase